MRMSRRPPIVHSRFAISCLASFITALGATAVRAQSFAGVGFLPGGTQSGASHVSRDGSVVVGTASNHAFRWTAALGMVDLGTLPGGTFSWGADVSDDGSVVVGSGDSTLGTRVFRWTSAGGMVDLGLPLDGGGDVEAANSFGVAVSGSGAAIAGFSDPVNQALRWTSGGGMVSLGTLRGGGGYSIAYDCSFNGSVIVGESTGDVNDHAFRWTEGYGLEDLGTMPGGTLSRGRGVSADGNVVVGWGSTGIAGIRAFRWTSAVGMVSLGAPTGMGSRASGVSGNGQVVVGVITSPDHAMLWTPTLGMVDLNMYLPTLHLNLTGWTLTSANAVSADGLTIVGTGTHNGRTEGWVARLPSPAAAGGVPESGAPLMVRRSSTPGDLELSWGASCRSADSDYAVYEGTIGAFAGHVPRLCSTSGATVATLTPVSGDSYYLVVPMSPGGAEGSYGTVSGGQERPPSALACQPQVFSGCP